MVLLVNHAVAAFTRPGVYDADKKIFTLTFRGLSFQFPADTGFQVYFQFQVYLEVPCVLRVPGVFIIPIVLVPGVRRVPSRYCFKVPFVL